jgi:hypothetical protein
VSPRLGPLPTFSEPSPAELLVATRAWDLRSQRAKILQAADNPEVRGTSVAVYLLWDVVVSLSLLPSPSPLWLFDDDVD